MSDHNNLVAAAGKRQACAHVEAANAERTRELTIPSLLWMMAGVCQACFRPGLRRWGYLASQTVACIRFAIVYGANSSFALDDLPCAEPPFRYVVRRTYIPCTHILLV